MVFVDRELVRKLVADLCAGEWSLSEMCAIVDATLLKPFREIGAPTPNDT